MRPFCDFAPDLAAPDEPKLFPGQFKADAPVPSAVFDFCGMKRYFAGHGEHERDGKLSDGNVVCAHCVFHLYAKLCGSVQVDIVHADAVLGNGFQVFEPFEHRPRQGIYAYYDPDHTFTGKICYFLFRHGPAEGVLDDLVAFFLEQRVCLVLVVPERFWCYQDFFLHAYPSFLRIVCVFCCVFSSDDAAHFMRVIMYLCSYINTQKF